MRGDAKVIDYLNRGLRAELTATNQYWLHYRVFDNWGYRELAKKWREESIEEMHHADHFAKRILFLEGFPNMLMLMGPHTALGNIPRSIEYNVDFVTNLISHLYDHHVTRVECRPEGVAAWTEHVRKLGEGLLSNEIDSWMTGINRNVDGKTERIVARYSGSAPAYRARCDAVAAGGYREMALA